MEYLKFFEDLHKKKVRYLICGGLAVNIYGIPRMTADIDLLIDFEEKNLNTFETVVESFNYRPLLPIKLGSLTDEKKRKELKQEKNLIAFSYYNSKSNLMNVDVLVETPLNFNEMWQKRVVRKIGESEVNLVSVEHLIEMKKFSDRIQDRQDIIHLSNFLKSG